MNPNAKTVIPISRLTSFLCHPGARVGYFSDPPTSSVAVEGGWYSGDLYDGVVLAPTAPTTGASRVDSVVANPDSGNIELVEGTENSGSPPTLPKSPVYGLIANITVLSRTNGEILIEAQDIEDRRSLIAPAKDASRYILIDDVIVSVGLKNSSSDTGLFLVGQTKGPFTCKKQWGNRPNHGLAFDYGRSSGVEVQLTDDDQWNDKPASDFVLTCQLYGSAVQAGTSESHAHFVTVSWQRLSTEDYSGNASFRLEVVASPQDGNTGLIGSYYNASGERKQTKRVNLHVQIWQRVTA